MTSVRLTDGRVLHLPGAPHVRDSHGVLSAPADAELAALVPLIPPAELLLFTGRLVTGARKRRRQERYAEMNAARLKLARLCIDQALAEWQAAQEPPPMREDALRVAARPDGRHEVKTVAGEVLAVCATNAEAWGWIDRRSNEGRRDSDQHYRIRNSERFS